MNKNNTVKWNTLELKGIEFTLPSNCSCCFSKKATNSVFIKVPGLKKKSLPKFYYCKVCYNLFRRSYTAAFFGFFVVSFFGMMAIQYYFFFKDPKYMSLSLLMMFLGWFFIKRNDKRNELTAIGVTKTEKGYLFSFKNTSYYKLFREQNIANIVLGEAV